MALELYYTSAPKGLRPGSSGFCTVALTRAMPAPLIARLEALSAYRPLYAAGSANESRNPVSHAHYRVNIGGRMYSILSRVRFAGTDYSHRSNKFAHHVALEPEELAPGGPAWMVHQPGVLAEAWEGEPRKIEEPRRVPYGDRTAGVCKLWEQVTGDAGWAGVLAERFVLDASKPVYLLYESGQDILGLFEEVVALLPPEARWRATFNTYLSQLPSGVACAWRGCVLGTRAAREAVSANGALLIDLSRRLEPPHESRYVTLARTGEMIVLPSSVTLNEPSVEFEEPDDEPLKVAPLEDEPREARPRQVYIAPASMPRRETMPRAEIPTWFWLVALAWPVLVLGVGMLLYLQQAAATRLAEDRAQQAELRVADLEDQVTGLEQQRDGLQRRIDDVRDERTQRQIELQRSLANRAQRSTPPANTSRRTSRPAPRSTRAQSRQPLPPTRTFENVERGEPFTPSEADRKSLAQRIPSFSNHFYVDLPELVHPSRGITRRTVVLFDKVAIDAWVELKLPGIAEDASDAEEFAVEQCSDGCNVLLRLADDRWAELASLRKVERVLWWDWKVPASVTGQTAALRRLDQLVRLGSVEIHHRNTSSIFRIQFIEPETHELLLSEQAARVTLFDQPTNVQLEITNSPQGWTDADADAPGLLRLKNAQDLTLELHANNSGPQTEVVADWPDGSPETQYNQAKGVFTQALFDWDTNRTRYRDQLRSIESDVRDHKQALQRTDDEAERRRIENQLAKTQQEQDTIEQSMQDERAKFEQITDRYHAAQANYEAMATMKPFQVICRQAESEAVLALLKVSVPEDRQRQGTRSR